MQLQPSRWNKRSQRTPEFCPGACQWWGDFIYYEPWRRCVINESEGIRLVNGPRHNIPDGHPTGWSFDTVSDGYKPNAQEGANDRDGSDDDIPTDDVKNDRTGGASPSNAERIISPQENGVYEKWVDAHEDENRICDVCE